MTWEDAATENLRAARLLDREGHPRASVTRSYYAAYCAVTAELDRRGIRTFGRFNNPPHSRLGTFVSHNIGLTPAQAVQMDRTISSLRLMREDADYRPALSVGSAESTNALRDAANVLIDLGIAIM